MLSQHKHRHKQDLHLRRDYLQLLYQSFLCSWLHSCPLTWQQHLWRLLCDCRHYHCLLLDYSILWHQHSNESVQSQFCRSIVLEIHVHGLTLANWYHWFVPELQSISTCEHCSLLKLFLACRQCHQDWYLLNHESLIKDCKPSRRA